MDVQPLSGKSLLALRHPSPSIEAYEGSVRSGKTVTSLLDWVKFIRTGPAGALAMCGRTERTVINNLILPLQEMLGTQRVRINYGTGVVTICGREVHVYGANNEQSRTKIQGATLAGAYADEASTMPESFVQMLYSRLSVPGAKMWLTANPEGPQHWLKKDWLDRARLWINKHSEVITNDDPTAMDLHRYTFILDDNPALPPEYVERIKRSYTGVWRRRYIEAEWVVAAGSIYDMWEPAHHVVSHDSLPHMQELIAIGIDYGTSNPTAATLLGIGDDGRLYAVDEWVWSGKTSQPLSDAVLAKRLAEWAGENGYQPRFWIADPSAASLRTEMQTVHRIVTTPGDNDVLYGIRTVASLLTEGSLLVSDRCKNLIDEFPGYVWDVKATERGEDKPVKTNDHSLDSLRYAVVTTENIWTTRVRRDRAAA